MHISTKLSQLFNQVLGEQRVPQAWKHGRITPILKRNKDGVPGDPADPDSYRGITVGSTIGKVFGLALLTRLTHWCERNDLLSPEQAAFRPLRGCEQHVWTLIEVCRRRRASGQDTFLLFVDFKKAYDNVHREALWAVLQHVGLPQELLALLRNWNLGRTCSVRVNRSDSAPFPAEKGVPQGDALSPLFFSLSLESLIRAINADEGLSGVTIGDVTIRCLVYADDIVILCPSWDETQLAASLVQRWCDAWGHAMGFGSGKTQAMVIPGLGSQVQPMGPIMVQTPSAAGGTQSTQIEWTDTYKYLGYMLCSDLRETVTMDRVVHRLKWNVSRVFSHTGAIAKLAPRTQLQILKTLAISTVNYLACLLPDDASQCRDVDAVILSTVRRILKAPQQTPVSLIWSESGVTTFLGVIQRERVRFKLQTEMAPFANSIVKRVYTQLGAQSAWIRRTNAAIGRATERGIPAPVPAALHRVTFSAALFGREVSFQHWLTVSRVGQDHSAANVVIHQRPASSTARTTRSQTRDAAQVAGTVGKFHHRPSLVDAGRFVGELHGTFCEPALPRALLNTRSMASPLSMRGPGCHGSITSLTSLSMPAVAVLVRAKLGHLTLECWPFRPDAVPAQPSPERPQYPANSAGVVLEELHISDIESDDDGEVVPAAQHSRPSRSSRVRYMCTGCMNGSVQPLQASGLAGEDHNSRRPDLWHVLFECPYYRFVEFRNSLHAQCAGVIERVVAHARKIQAITLSPLMLQEMLSAQQEGNPVRLPDTAVGRMIIFRMLVGLTWTASYAATSPVADPWTPLATELGTVFDSVTVRVGLRRPLANAWANWSTHQLMALAAVYKTGLVLSA
ncbi:MAG: RNA-directed DNA polymerase [Limnohabitans sp.]